VKAGAGRIQRLAFAPLRVRPTALSRFKKTSLKFKSLSQGQFGVDIKIRNST
jgi:hypothetical protein